MRGANRVAVLAVVAAMVLAACSTDTTASTTQAAGAFGTTTTVSADSAESTTTEATGTTEASTTTTSTTEAATTTTVTQSDGTFDDPVPAGEWHRVGDVDIVVLAVDTDATDEVLAASQFNSEPEPGNRFVTWRVGVTNAGGESMSAVGEVLFSVVGPSAVAYDAGADCGVVPDGLDRFRDVFPGGSLEGNLCWEVSDDDAGSLVFLAEGFAIFSDQVVFAAAESDEALAVDFPVPAAPDPDGPPGSRGNPYPVGETVTVGDWEMVVTGLTEDAIDAVHGENPFNDEPAEGRQFLMVELEATYTGENSDSLVSSAEFNVVGPTAVAYTFEDSCGIIPDELDVWADVFPGGTVSGNLCWSVRTEDVDELVLYSQESFDFDDEVAFFALR
jgi:hypothetical protein